MSQKLYLELDWPGRGSSRVGYRVLNGQDDRPLIVNLSAGSQDALKELKATSVALVASLGGSPKGNESVVGKLHRRLTKQEPKTEDYVFQPDKKGYKPVSVRMPELGWTATRLQLRVVWGEGEQRREGSEALVLLPRRHVALAQCLLAAGLFLMAWWAFPIVRGVFEAPEGEVPKELLAGGLVGVLGVFGVDHVVALSRYPAFGFGYRVPRALCLLSVLLFVLWLVPPRYLWVIDNETPHAIRIDRSRVVPPGGRAFWVQAGKPRFDELRPESAELELGGNEHYCIGEGLDNYALHTPSCKYPAGNAYNLDSTFRGVPRLSVRCKGQRWETLTPRSLAGLELKNAVAVGDNVWLKNKPEDCSPLDDASASFIAPSGLAKQTVSGSQRVRLEVRYPWKLPQAAGRAAGRGGVASAERLRVAVAGSDRLTGLEVDTDGATQRVDIVLSAPAALSAEWGKVHGAAFKPAVSISCHETTPRNSFLRLQESERALDLLRVQTSGGALRSRWMRDPGAHFEGAPWLCFESLPQPSQEEPGPSVLQKQPTHWSLVFDRRQEPADWRLTVPGSVLPARVDVLVGKNDRYLFGTVHCPTEVRPDQDYQIGPVSVVMPNPASAPERVLAASFSSREANGNQSQALGSFAVSPSWCASAATSLGWVSPWACLPKCEGVRVAARLGHYECSNKLRRRVGATLNTNCNGELVSKARVASKTCYFFAGTLIAVPNSQACRKNCTLANPRGGCDIVYECPSTFECRQ